MRTIHVSNLKLQFDAPNDGSPLELTQSMVDSINEVLSSSFPNAQPQIFSSAIDSSDIEEL